MKRFLLILLFATLPLLAQPGPVSVRPDCFQFFTFTATGNSNVFDNRSAGCPYFAIAYSSNGFSVESLVVQTAPDAGGTPGSWSTYTANSGINPNTAITQASSTFSGYFPWVRVQLTSVTGTGSIQGVLYGWRTPADVIAGGGVSGCVGTVGTPCVVVGPTAAGAPPTTSPVMAAGQDGAPGNIRVVHTDTVGNQRVVGAAADGAAVVGDPVRIGAKDGSGNTQDILTNTAGNLDPAGAATAQADAATNTPNVPTASGAASFQPVFPYSFNGSTWDRSFACTNQTAVITLTDATRTVLVAASGSTNIRICHIHFTTSGAAEEVTISTGTGAACVTGNAVIDDYLGVTAIATDFQPTAALRGGASNAVCVTQSGAAQTAKVVAVYAQF